MGHYRGTMGHYKGTIKGGGGGGALIVCTPQSTIVPHSSY